jgi:hypothetical protein
MKRAQDELSGDHAERHRANQDRKQSCPEQKKDPPALSRGGGRPLQVVLQQRHVSNIRLESEVEEIAQQGDFADECIDPGIHDHAGKGGLGSAQAGRLEDDVGGEQPADDVTDARHQPDDRIQTEAEAGSGDRKCSVEHPADGAKTLDLSLGHF